MHSISSASIESLPNELLLPILEACAVPSLFSVCKRWHHLLASEAMPSLYRKIARLHFPRGNANSQRTIMLAKVYQLNPGLTSTEKVYQVFKQVFTLVKSISPLEFKEKTEEKRGLTLVNYSSYLLNINRLLLWKKLPGGEEYLSREEIKHLPLEKKGELLRDWIEENCKNLTSLNLAGAGLTYLPSEICQLSQLRELHLSQNQLTALPEEIGQLSELQSLDLSENELTSLPLEIGRLSQLEWLYLSQNQLASLPAEIGQLSKLQELNLSQNQLTSLPAEILQLPQLQWLDLSQNQLTNLPATIGQLSQLQQGLYLNQNQLTSLPAGIVQLSQLQTLELAGNPSKDIAEKIRQRFQL
ncbi:F-box protein [Neochlamydia sp. EPS4]|uniref:F-box/LRR-repeat protein n=1 Tax=Neochlamydia sp. EPS4 TaxID=1478175 RepID=UPI00069405F4|nr:F-box protein [Neochlamydia sp. EPS4]